MDFLCFIAPVCEPVSSIPSWPIWKVLQLIVEIYLALRLLLLISIILSRINSLITGKS